MYIEELKIHCIDISSHVTRFSEILASSIDDLVIKNQNNVATACFTQTIDDLYWEHYINPDTYIRNEIFRKENGFEGYFDEDSQMKSIPIPLLTLMSFLIDGAYNGGSNVSQAALSCSQLVMYNCRKEKIVATTSYHSKKRETPIVIYTSLKIYAMLRDLIDHFFSLGICLLYKRVLDITKYLYEKLRLSFNLNQVFLSGVLKKDLFTILAKDNIDKNARSTFAKSHYHGTTITCRQKSSCPCSNHTFR